MIKNKSAKELATELFNAHGLKKAKDIVRELENLINLTTVKVYYCGNLDTKSKEQINKWLSNKISGAYDINYTEDASLIAGFKIVYKDYIYDSSILNSFKSEIWK